MEQGTFQWLGSGQIYSSSRDMATFLAANIGDLADHGPIESAMAFAQQPVFTVSPRLSIGLAWQIVSSGNLSILDKNGGLNNTSTYIGFAPQSKLGVVILVNRGKQHATGIGRQILHALAQEKSEPSNEGEPDRTRIDSPRQLPFSAADRLDDLADCIDDKLWLLHLDDVAAVRVADVLRVEKLRETFLSGSPRRPCLRASGAKVKSLIRGEHDDRDRGGLAGRYRADRGCARGRALPGHWIRSASSWLRGTSPTAQASASSSETPRRGRPAPDRTPIGVRAREEPGNQTAPGVSDKNIGPRFLGCDQQGMQIRDSLLCRGRLSHRRGIGSVSSFRAVPGRS